MKLTDIRTRTSMQGDELCIRVKAPGVNWSHPNHQYMVAQAIGLDAYAYLTHNCRRVDDVTTKQEN